MRGYKARGTNFERTLVKLFWENGFASLRVAGSGSAPLSLPDIIAIKKGRIIAIECKTCSNDSFYLKNKDIDQLDEFREVSGCEAYVAVKFQRIKPKVFPLDLIKGKKISKNDTSLALETLFGFQKTL